MDGVAQFAWLVCVKFSEFLRNVLNRISSQFGWRNASNVGSWWTRVRNLYLLVYHHYWEEYNRAGSSQSFSRLKKSGVPTFFIFNEKKMDNAAQSIYTFFWNF